MIYEIPLRPQAQTLTTTIAGTRVGLSVYWVDADDGGWCLDLSNASGQAIAVGLMLVPSVDLLAQLAYLDLGAVLYLYSDDGVSYPTFTGLGVTSHLVWAPTGG